MKKGRFLILLLWLVLLFCISLYSQSKTDFKIIVHKNNEVSSISKSEISDMFLKKVKKYDNATKILPVDMIDTSPVRQQFSKDVLGKKVASVKAYWQKQIFSGRNVPPPEKKNDKEVLEYIHGNPGAIGYISVSTSIGNYEVKAVKIN